MESRREHPKEHLAIREMITSELVHRDNLRRMYEVMSSDAFQSHLADGSDLKNVVNGILANTKYLLDRQYNQGPWNIRIETRDVALRVKQPGQKEEVEITLPRVFAADDENLIDTIVADLMQDHERLEVVINQMHEFASAMQPLLTQAISITDAKSSAGAEMGRILAQAASAGLPQELSEYSNGVSPIYVVQRGPRYKMLLEGLQAIENGKNPPQIFKDISGEVQRNISMIGDITKRANDVFGQYSYLVNLDSQSYNAIFTAAMQPDLFSNPSTFADLLREYDDLQKVLDAPDAQFDPKIKQEVGQQIKECQQIILGAIRECARGERSERTLGSFREKLAEKTQTEKQREQLKTGFSKKGQVDKLDMQRQSIDLIYGNTLNNVSKIIAAELAPPEIKAKQEARATVKPKNENETIERVGNLEEAFNAPISVVLDSAAGFPPLLAELQECLRGIHEHQHYSKITRSNKNVVELLGKFIEAIKNGAQRDAIHDIRDFAITKNVSHKNITMKELFVAAISEAVSKQVMSATNTSDVLSAIMFGSKDICVMLAKDTTSLHDIKITPQQKAVDLFDYYRRTDDKKAARSAQESLEKQTIKIASDVSAPQTVNELMFIMPKYASTMSLGRRSIKGDIQQAAKSAEETAFAKRDSMREVQARKDWKRQHGVSIGRERRHSASDAMGGPGSKKVIGKSASDPTPAPPRSLATPPPSINTPTSESDTNAPKPEKKSGWVGSSGGSAKRSSTHSTLFSSRSRSGSASKDKQKEIADEAVSKRRSRSPGRGGDDSSGAE